MSVDATQAPRRRPDPARRPGAEPAARAGPPATAPQPAAWGLATSRAHSPDGFTDADATIARALPGRPRGTSAQPAARL
jgi:hypothetical protein